MLARRGLLIVLLAATVLLAVSATSLASQPATSAKTYRCTGITAAGQAWTIYQANTNCRFARYAVALAVEKRKRPANWRCRLALSGEFSPEQVPYRVRCWRGEKRVLGIVR